MAEIEMKAILEEPRVKTLANGTRRVTFLVQSVYWNTFQRLIPHTGREVVLIVIPGELGPDTADVVDHVPSLDDEPIHAPPSDRVDGDDEPPSMTLEEYAQIQAAAQESDRAAQESDQEAVAVS